MMPDFHQEGQAETKQWQPEQKAPVILLENVSKTYGKIHALTGITLALSGGVTGILGLNGAGKSTLFKILMGKYNDPNDPGEITHFQALTSALASTVGLGNISGVAIAIQMGGPGALFWMWVSALLGMSTKFFSCTFILNF